ncbi:MAG: type II toxin-antitoxin system HicA family toxin [Alphaproteobacteria bacterium]|nr:MAG: type II toxin-antitoxin system HicA family toxin [Alphaproteobacteria bacterium]
MVRGVKLLERMRANPRDWRIEDVETLCAAFGLELHGPPGGSHYGIKHDSQVLRLTIPFRRPIKAVYVRQLVRYVDAVRAAREEQT